MIALAPREGPHSPHSSLVSTLLEEGKDKAGEEAGKKERKAILKDRRRLQLGFLQA